MVALKKGLQTSLALLTLAQVSAAQADYRADIEARIKPVGQVQVQGDDSTMIAVEKPSKQAAAEVKTAARSGEDIYKQHCVVCHAAGVAGAPKSFDKAAWQPRLEKNKDLDGLTASAIKGLNAMPPKGTCMNCSDEELKSAVQFMLPK